MIVKEELRFINILPISMYKNLLKKKRQTQEGLLLDHPRKQLNKFLMKESKIQKKELRQAM